MGIGWRGSLCVSSTQSISVEAIRPPSCGHHAVCLCLHLLYNIALMHWDASSVMYPGVIGCFGSHNIIHPRPGDPAKVDQAPTCNPVATHRTALFNQGHLVAFSAASLADWMALFLVAPIMPNRVRTLWAHRVSSSLCPCAPPPAPGTQCVSSCWLPQYALPRALSAPA